MKKMIDTMSINMEQLVINIDDLPSGYRFLPNDSQLINSYLWKKVYGMDVPANVIQEIDASEFYRLPPSRLFRRTRDERGSYFFIHRDSYFNGKFHKSKEVGDGIGVWKSSGNEIPIYDENDDIFAYKTRVEYYIKDANNEQRKTHWRMQLWRLSIECREGDEEREEWVLGRLHGQGSSDSPDDLVYDDFL